MSGVLWALCREFTDSLTSRALFRVSEFKDTGVLQVKDVPYVYTVECEILIPDWSPVFFEPLAEKAHSSLWVFDRRWHFWSSLLRACCSRYVNGNLPPFLIHEPILLSHGSKMCHINSCPSHPPFHNPLKPIWRLLDHIFSCCLSTASRVSSTC